MSGQRRRWIVAAAALGLLVAPLAVGVSNASAATVPVPVVCAASLTVVTVTVDDIIELGSAPSGCTVVSNSASGNLDRVSGSSFVAFAPGSGTIDELLTTGKKDYLNRINVTIVPKAVPTPAPTVPTLAPSASSPSATPTTLPAVRPAVPDVAVPTGPTGQQSLTGSDIAISSGPDAGTLVVTSRNGNPLQLLSVTGAGGVVETISTGQDFSNPANWQRLGYGDICWGNTGFGNASAAVLPGARPPFRTVPAPWVLSAAIVVTASGNVTYVEPDPGQIVTSGDRQIRTLVLCSRAVEPTTRSAARPVDNDHGGEHHSDHSKITICHIPPGNPANAHLITVASNAARAHYNHGDYIPTAAHPCGRPPTVTQPVLPSRPPITASPTPTPTPTPTPAATNDPDETIGYCEATRNRDAPYRFAQAGMRDLGSVLKVGPLYPTAGWGDIVPPFADFPGQNWPAGQTLLTEFFCELPAVIEVVPTPTVTPVATPTAVLTPTPTPTSVPIASPTASPSLVTPTSAPASPPPLRPVPTSIPASPLASPTAGSTSPTATPTAVPTPQPPTVVAPTRRPDPPTLAVLIAIPLPTPTTSGSTTSPLASPSASRTPAATPSPTAAPTGQSSTASPLASPSVSVSATATATPTAVPSGQASVASPIASPPVNPSGSATAGSSASAGPGTPDGSLPPSATAAIPTPTATTIPTPGVVTLVVTNGPDTVTIKRPLTTLEEKVARPQTGTGTERLANTGADDLLPVGVTVLLLGGGIVVVTRRRRWSSVTAATLVISAVALGSGTAWSTVSESRAYDTAQAQAAASWQVAGAVASIEFRRSGGGRPVTPKALYVFPGVTADALAKGPGWYTSTSRPGEAGNFAIAGHRTGFGSPFAHLDELRVGDSISVRDQAGDTVTYRVQRVALVAPDADWVLGSDPLGTGRPTLTLTTCDPPHVNSHRLVVFATKA